MKDFAVFLWKNRLLPQKGLTDANGKSAEIGFHTSRGEAVCFVNIWNRSRSSIAIDRFILEKMD